jgi:hypothetical protein
MVVSLRGIRLIKSKDGQHVTVIVNGHTITLTLSEWSLLIANPERG